MKKKLWQKRGQKYMFVPPSESGGGAGAPSSYAIDFINKNYDLSPEDDYEFVVCMSVMTISIAYMHGIKWWSI